MRVNFSAISSDIQNEKAASMKLSRPYLAAGGTVALMAVFLLCLFSSQLNVSKPKVAAADAGGFSRVNQ